jgi:hypothetical protein
MRLGRAPLGACLLAALSCSDGAAPVDAGGGERRLTIPTPPGPDIGLPPGGEQSLRARHTDGSRPLPGVKIQFAIFGDPRGSTLSADSASTNSDGEAAVMLRAGAMTARFQVRVSAPKAKDAVFYVAVSNAGFGALRVGSQYAGALPETKLERISYRLYARSCATIDPLKPDDSVPERVVDGLAAKVAFNALPLDEDIAVVVVAADSSLHALATGCVEVPHGTLKPKLEVLVVVELRDLPFQLAGSYALESDVQLPQAPAPGSRPLSDALRAWSDLSDCHEDPAQLLIDCVLDAIDPGDPLDCQIGPPSAKTAALIAERGVLAGGCRGEQTDRGTLSLDRKLRLAMEATSTATLASIASVATSASGLLRHLRTRSTLVVLSLSAAGDISFSHRLDAVGFPGAGVGVLYQVSEVGLPQPMASPVAGRVSTWQLKIEEHSVSMRYGLIARLALGQLVLLPAGLPDTSAKLAGQVAALVKQPAGSTMLVGCPAIEAIACEAARLDAGCLGAACLSGLSALAAYLDGGFAQIDAPRADLTWRGEVELVDEDADRLADALGKKEAPGIWKARLLMGTESVTPEESTFLGKRL